jgi:3-ketosteroid 9alpha-monooxygenase subunit B
MVEYFLSQENSAAHGSGYTHGRPAINHVQNLIQDPTRTLFFACGPAITKWQKRQALETKQPPSPRFMEWVHEIMETLKVDKKRFKREIYG